MTDNFRVADPNNRNAVSGPQGMAFPSGWSELRLTATAPPLDEQEVVCSRDALHEGLANATKTLKEVADEVAALEAATAGATALALDQTVRLNQAGDKLRDALAALRDATQEAALAPDLRPLATAVRAIVDQQLRGAEEALRRAETDSPAARAEAFAAARAHLRDADAKLSECSAHNNQLARARLDRLKLIALATDQSALADAKSRSTRTPRAGSAPCSPD